MEEKNKKSQVLKITIFITSIFVILISVSYAFITQTFAGTKKQVITAGVLDLVLDEKSEITISDALPMYDNVGMMQEEVYEFDLINNTTNDTKYTIKLNKVSTSDLDESIVKYGLIKDGQQKIAFLSTLNDGVIDSGVVTGSDTIEYELRLWIDSNVTDENLISGKSLSYTLSVEVGQAQTKAEKVLLTYNANTPILETESLDMGEDEGTAYFYKISNSIFTEEDLIGAYGIVSLADGTEQRFPIIDGTLIDMTENGVNYGSKFSNQVFFMTEDFNETLPNGVTWDALSLTKGVWITDVLASSITEFKIVQPIIDYGNEKIVFEWNKGDLVLGTYTSGFGDLNRYAKKPLPRASELVGYKLIYESSDGTILEKVLTEDNIAEEDIYTGIDVVTLISVFDEGTAETNPQGWPLGVYLLASAEESDYVRITLMKP